MRNFFLLINFRFLHTHNIPALQLSRISTFMLLPFRSISETNTNPSGKALWAAGKPVTWTHNHASAAFRTAIPVLERSRHNRLLFGYLWSGLSWRDRWQGAASQGVVPRYLASLHRQCRHVMAHHWHLYVSFLRKPSVSGVAADKCVTTDWRTGPMLTDEDLCCTYWRSVSLRWLWSMAQRVTGENKIRVKTWELPNETGTNNFMVMNPETSRQSYGQNTAWHGIRKHITVSRSH